MTTDDWLAVCRDVAGTVRDAATGLRTRGERERTVDEGEGGDRTTAVDEVAERAAVERLERRQRERGVSFALVSEELGERSFGAGDGRVVVLDPIDGSLNAKRLVPYDCVSVAVADGPTLDRVQLGYVLDLAGGEEWVARRRRRRARRRAGRPHRG